MGTPVPIPRQFEYESHIIRNFIKSTFQCDKRRANLNYLAKVIAFLLSRVRARKPILGRLRAYLSRGGLAKGGSEGSPLEARAHRGGVRGLAYQGEGSRLGKPEK